MRKVRVDEAGDTGLIQNSVVDKSEFLSENDKIRARKEAGETELVGLKENVIIGKLLPAGTGVHRYRDVTIEKKYDPSEDILDSEDMPIDSGISYDGNTFLGKSF